MHFKSFLLGPELVLKLHQDALRANIRKTNQQTTKANIDHEIEESTAGFEIRTDHYNDLWIEEANMYEGKKTIKMYCNENKVKFEHG